jgi:hypothetical protein
MQAGFPQEIDSAGIDAAETPPVVSARFFGHPVRSLRVVIFHIERETP